MTATRRTLIAGSILFLAGGWLLIDVLGFGSLAGEDATPIVERAPSNSAKKLRGLRDVEERAGSIDPLGEISLASLRQTVERPLFNQSRAPKPKPVQQVEAEEEPQASTPDLTLVGIAVTNDAKTLVLRLNETNEVLHLKTGQGFSEWRVMDVHARSVVIGNGKSQFPLELFAQPSQLSNPSDAAEPADPDEEDGNDQAEAVSELNNG